MVDVILLDELLETPKHSFELKDLLSYFENPKSLDLILQFTPFYMRNKPWIPSLITLVLQYLVYAYYTILLTLFLSLSQTYHILSD